MKRAADTFQAQNPDLRFEAIPVDDYYNGWQINISNNGEYYTSIISDYQGKDRKIIITPIYYVAITSFQDI